MRFFSLFAIACATFQATSAIPVSKPANELAARDDTYLFFRNAQALEGRGEKWKPKVSKKPKAGGPHITFEKGVSPHSAHDHLDSLRLHGNKRKTVEKYHTKVVATHMKTIGGAHSAIIKNLAHARGSRDSDPNIHISAAIHKKNGKIIVARRHGNPTVTDFTHHIYTNKEHPHDGCKPLPIQYKKAVDKKSIREGKKPGRV